jgi:hypothetical protein
MCRRYLLCVFTIYFCPFFTHIFALFVLLRHLLLFPSSFFSSRKRTASSVKSSTRRKKTGSKTTAIAAKV